MRKLVLLFVSLILVAAFNAGATVRNVPGTYPTIQAAINASVSGDIVQVAAGTYIESLTVVINNLTIQGASAATTKIRTIGTTPAITLVANGFTLKNLQITHPSQMKEGIRILAPAYTGFTMDGVYITKIGNGTDNAFGVNFTTSFSYVSVKNSAFSAVLSASRAIAFYGAKNFIQTNWLFEGNSFQYLYTGIYLNSAVNGITLQGNNFGPWDINDCRQAASALYVGDGEGDFNIDNVTVTGNTFNNYARGVYFLNNVAGKQIGTTTITNNIFTNSIWSSGVRLVAGTNGYGSYLPSVLEGPVNVCNNTFTQGTQIVNGSGVAMMDFRSVTGGESATSNITVCDNSVTFTGSFSLSTWGLLLRGPFANASVLGNTFAGNNAGGSSPDMPPTSGVCIQTNYYNYGPMNNTAKYVFNNNTITGFTNAIAIYDMLNKSYGAVPAGASIKANNNSIYNNTFGIQSGAGERTNARNNYWGTNTGPYHSTNTGGTGNPVSDYVDFLPWWCDATMTSICPTPGPGDAILNIDTYTWYPKTALGSALSAAANNHTLYIAPGEVNGGVTYNTAGKTVNIIGAGRVGESTITGPGRAISIYNGTLNFGNGLTLNTTNGTSSSAFKTLAIYGGNLKVRDCMLVEDPSSFQSLIYVQGGNVDFGTLTDPGHNLFQISGTGYGLYNVPLSNTVYAYGNDWGSTKGPSVGSNPGGNGASISGPGLANVLYNPWRAGPVTVASRLKACVGTTSVEIPVKIASFTAVGSLALELNYDPTKISNPVLSYQDAAFSQWGYLQINTTTPGTIIITGTSAWPHTGITLADSTTIFSLTFNLEPGTLYASLNFVENTAGTSCEYTGAAPYFLKFGDTPQATHYVNGSVTYDPNPPVPVSVTIAASANPVEPGSSVTLTATPVHGGPSPTYEWKVNGNTVSTAGASYTYTPVYGDEVKVLMTSNDQCITGNPATSNTITIYVLQFNVTSTDTVYNGETKCYNAGEILTVGGAPANFLVEVGGDATLIAGKKIVMLPGTTVQLGGHLWAYIAPVGPFCTPPISAPHFTGNQEPFFSASDEIRFKVFPNPTTDEFTMVQRGLDIFENVSMAIYSMEGRLVMSRELSGQKSYTFSAASYQPGFYIIRFTTRDHTETIKLIKMN